jgi:prepilin-type N-terminal cleavage/methylation domain-containing protein
MKREQGFTLIEAAVAIAVVAILSGIIVPLVIKNIGDSQTARAKNDVQVIAAAVAAQYKDLGARPHAASGTGATGVGDAIWGSPTGTAATNAPALGNNQTFLQLFAGMTGGVASVTLATAAQDNQLWGTTAGAEFSWKGPYLGWDVADKANPWGGKYYIFGYDANGQTNNTPIWVVCPGPDNTINTAVNPVANAVGLPQSWSTAGTSADDIAVRVN